tara:strand:- start:50084 stop:50272 length:189 start_codon:yes stop_codon:yes gene_type:complete
MDSKKFLEVLKSTEEMMKLSSKDNLENIEKECKEEYLLTPLIHQLQENRIKTEINRQTRRLR